MKPLSSAKVLLVSPPASYVDMPGLGLASLTAYLKAQGVGTVKIWDSNLEFLDYLLDPKTLKEQESRIREGQATGGTKDLQNRAFLMLPQVISSIRDAVSVFHDAKRYYDIAAYNRSMAIVQSALECYATEPGPLRHKFDQSGFNIELDRTQLNFSMADLIRFIREENSYRLFHKFFQSSVSKLKNNSPYDLVGFSCANPQQLLPALFLAMWMRNTGISKKFVIGGSFVTAAQGAICHNRGTFDLFDYVITYEGEKALMSLLDSVVTERGLDSVPNLHYRTEKEIRHNPAEKIDVLDDLPTPDFSEYPIRSYWTPEPVLPIYCTRGCYYDICTFCDHHSNYFGKFRARTTDRVLHDIKTYQKLYGATKLFFVDELLIPKQHVEIAERIAQAKLPTRWYSHSRVENYFTKERLETLAKGGATLLHVGLESANSRILELMKKGYDRERVLRFLRDLRETPMTAHLNTIRAFPGEQPEEYLETLDTVWEFAKAGDYVHLYGFALFHGAPIAGESGSPYVSSIRTRSPHDLDTDAEYSLVGMNEPTKEQSQRIERLRTQFGGQRIEDFNGLFPKDCCWAAHLLYVSHYREKEQGKKLDQALCEAEIIPPHGSEAFSSGQNLEEWEVSMTKNILMTATEGMYGSPWYVFSPQTFRWVSISEKLGTVLRDHGTRPLRAMEDFRLELYKLFRGGIIRLSRSKGIKAP